MSYQELSVFQGPRGHLCAAVEGMNLHSKMDPVRESQRICESSVTGGSDAVVIYGLGLGYVVEAVCAADPERPVILIEPEYDWIDEATRLRREAGIPLDLASHATLALIRCDHPDDLVVVLQDMGSRNPVLLPNAAIQKLRPDGFSVIKDAITAYKDRFQVNVNTLQRFGKLWVRNLSHNLPLLAECPGVNLFAQVFTGLPGLLVAGGPSLDTVIPHLKTLQQRMVIVAVDTSLRACLQAGVDPDFVVMVDPQYWNTRHLDGCATSRAKVIGESSIFPRSLRQTQGPIYLFSSLFPLGQYFENLVGLKGALGAGGSVATTAWDFLRYIGIRDAYTAGLDLSFPGGQTHFHGSVFEEACHRHSMRLNPAAQQRYAYLHSDTSYPCTSSSGETVLSDQRMDIYVHWFENQCRLHPEMHTQRIGHGSRSIAGFGEIELDACLALPECRNEIDIRLQLHQNDPSYDEQEKLDLQRERLNNGRLSLVQELRELLDLASQAMILIDKASQTAAAGGSDFRSAMVAIDQLDATLLGSGNRRIAGFLIEELIQEISTAAKADDLAQALELSRRLYSGLHDACAFHLALFDRPEDLKAQVHPLSYR